MVLVARGTRDEGYRWSAHHKEKRMYRTLETLQKNMVEKKINTTLSKFIDKQVSFIFVLPTVTQLGHLHFCSVLFPFTCIPKL